MSDTKGQRVDSRTRNAAIMLGFAALFNLVGNVAFHVLAARQTNVSVYGLIATLLSLGFLAASIGAGLQYAVARHAMVPGRDPRRLLGRSLWSCLPILLVVGALWFVVNPVSHYLHAASTAAIDATLAYFAVTIVGALPIGLLMAQRRFAALAATTAVAAIARLAMAVAIGWRHDPTAVALVTSSLAGVLAAGINSIVVVTRRAPSPEVAYRHEPRGAVRAEASRLAALGACLWSVWLLPIWFARHYVSSVLAGRFIVGHLAGSSLFYLAAPITTAYFPTILRSRSGRVARVGFLLTLGFGLFGAVCLGLLGPFVFNELMGVTFPPGHQLFFELGVSAATCAVASYVVWTSQARAARPAATALGAVAAVATELVIGASGFHGENLLALMPAVALAVGGLAGVALHLLQPAADAGLAELPAPLAVCGEPVAVVQAVPAGVPSLLPYLAVGVMACNEELTISQCLEALLNESESGHRLAKVIVVVSGSTDRTVEIVRSFARSDDRVSLVIEPSRTGKVNAINLYLERCQLPLAGLVNADVVLAPGALSLMAEAFRDDAVGMAGGRPEPQNEHKGLCNRLVHLEWQLHDAVSRHNPKLGEAVLFRRIFRRLTVIGTADEVAIEALLLDGGYELRYVGDAAILNHGPTTLHDYVRHRRRIHSGHIIQQKWDGYTPSTMRSGAVATGVVDALRRDPAILKILPFAVLAEMYIRATTVTFRVRRHVPEVGWDPIQSAKRAITSVTPGSPSRTADGGAVLNEAAVEILRHAEARSST
ncbi:MAG: glycosyltransferase [Acidimicrobiales bacterium]